MVTGFEKRQGGRECDNIGGGGAGFHGDKVDVTIIPEDEKVLVTSGGGNGVATCEVCGGPLRTV